MYMIDLVVNGWLLELLLNVIIFLFNNEVIRNYMNIVDGDDFWN